MKTRYFITSLLAGAALLAAVSCESKLDIPQHSVSSVESYYQTDAEAEEGIIAAYAAMRSLDFNMGNSPLYLTEMLSDDVWVGGGNHYDGTWYLLGDYTFGSDYGVISTVFTNLYNLIYRCNVVIEKVTGDSAVMKRAVAEARVLRAWANFQLVTLWGTAPLVDHTLQADEYLQGNSTPEALWAAVEGDLNTAINSGALTQKENVGKVSYRATKQFAQALLGKSLLFQKKYGEAATELDKVISSQLYDLNPDYSNIGTPLGAGDMESVFEINALNDRNVSANNSMGWTARGLRGEKYSYGDKNIFAGATWGYINPTKDLYDDFVAVEGVNGYRLNNVIKTRQQMKDEFTVENIMDITDNEGLWEHKHRILASHWAGYFYACNWRVMRYAEVLLLAAEANFNSGKTDKAVTYFNEVRTRAQAPTVSSLTMEDIKRETRLELCFEGHRFQNLIRWGDAATKLAKKGEKNPVLRTDGTVEWESYNKAGECGFKTGKHELLPFPATEIAVNTNIDQNKGW